MKIINDYPMSRVTTLGIGGPAKALVMVKTEEELIGAIKFAKEKGLEFLVIGKGSNLLVSDEGVDKLVIKNEISGITMANTSDGGRLSLRSHDSSEVSVKSGTPLQELVDFTITHGLSGLQKLTGIPGTVGGAIYGAAGAYGQEIVDHLVSVKILNPSSVIASEATPEAGEAKQSLLKFFTKKECGFGYRDSNFKKNGFIILEITFHLESGDPWEFKKEADEILKKRLKKYPKGIKCPGSFFKNLVVSNLPKEVLEKIPSEKQMYGKISAGALLEEVGAKGDSLDGIEIAPYHANLFINRGSGKAKDFYNLAKKYFLKVKKKYGISLEPEVQLINLPPFN